MQYIFDLCTNMRKRRNDSIKHVIEGFAKTLVHSGDIKTHIFEMGQRLARIMRIGDAQIIVDEERCQ